MFKIQDSKTGLYSSGGYDPSWSEHGKLYHSLGEVKAALALYERGRPIQGRLAFRTAKARAEEAKRRQRKVPPTWTIVEFELKPLRTLSAVTAMNRLHNLNTLGSLATPVVRPDLTLTRMRAVNSILDAQDKAALRAMNRPAARSRTKT